MRASGTFETCRRTLKGLLVGENRKPRADGQNGAFDRPEPDMRNADYLIAVFVLRPLQRPNGHATACYALSRLRSPGVLPEAA
jgi:hypothetical protein